MIDFTQKRIADRICAAATKSLLYEVSATPKPGLVDKHNNGSHKDMCFNTFIDSAMALIPWFIEFFNCGQINAKKDSKSVFLSLRELGIKAEYDMRQATGGVNTHKGCVFAFSIMIGAYGAVYANAVNNGEENICREAIIDKIKEIAACSLEDFNKASEGQTNGLKLYNEYHIKGARGEASEGFPTALNIGMPELKKNISEGYDTNDAMVKTMLVLISKVVDTNMISRGGMKKADTKMKLVESRLKDISKDNIYEIADEIDQDFIDDNMSPGGCADILAASMFFYLLERDNLW